MALISEPQNQTTRKERRDQDTLVQVPDSGSEEESKGGPWIDLRVRIPKRTRKPANHLVPESTEPEIVWLLSGESVVEERVLGGHWLKTAAKKGDFYLTAPGPA